MTDSVDDFVDGDWVIDHDFGGDTRRRMMTQHAPANAFLHTTQTLNLNTLVKPITHQNKYTNKFYSVETQLDQLDWFLDNLDKPNLIVVSSYPNDRLSKQVGAYIMGEATREFYAADADRIKRSSEQKINPPRWHPVYATFDDPIVKETRAALSTLYVFSDVPDTATPRKLELLRELLVKTSRVPRVVVTASNNPLEFAEQLRMPLDAALWLHR